MFYVNMVDRNLSGWGMAKGGVSRYSIRCASLDVAEAIQKAAQDRPEMRYINISTSPARKRSQCDHVSIKDAAELGGPWLKYIPTNV